MLNIISECVFHPRIKRSSIYYTIICKDLITSKNPSLYIPFINKMSYS